MNFSTTEIEPSFLAPTSINMHQCYCTLYVRVGKSSTLRKLTAKPGATHTTVVSRITNHTLSSDRQLRDVPEDTQMKMNSIIMHQCCFYCTHTPLNQTYLQMGNYLDRCQTCHHFALQIKWQSTLSSCPI